MSTTTFHELTSAQQQEVRMFGALREDVHAAVTSYLVTKSPKNIVTDMMMSAWSEANWGDVEDARQTLNRVKVTIERFYCGEPRDFFVAPEGKAYCTLSDAQEMLAQDDIISAKMCIDEASDRIAQGVNIIG